MGARTNKYESRKREDTGSKELKYLGSLIIAGRNRKEIKIGIKQERRAFLQKRMHI